VLPDPALTEHSERNRVQFISKPEISHSAGFILWADERFDHRIRQLAEKVGVRMQLPLQICLGSRKLSRNRDKQLTIIRVIRHLKKLNYLYSNTLKHGTT
jgi:hypothetical protein